jgi:hypothetical protein
MLLWSRCYAYTTTVFTTHLDLHTKGQDVNNCRQFFHVPPTDLVGLQRELMTHGPEVALPQNLPDEWLRALVRDMLTAVASGDEENLGVKLLVLALVSAQGRDGTTQDSNVETFIQIEPISSYIASYQLALADELVARQIGTFACEYTVANIFE